MSPITPLSPATSPVTVPKPVDNNSAIPATSKTSVSRSQNTDISILTAEGDKVTLSASFSAQAEFATYDSRGIAGNNGRHSERSASLTVERSFSFSVEGDLSREELKDIRKAIRTIQKATHDVLSGNPEKAAQRASKLERLDTIAQLEAEVGMTRKVSVETTVQAAAKPEEQQPERIASSVPEPSPVEVATDVAPAQAVSQSPVVSSAALTTPLHLVKQSETSLNLFFEMIAKLRAHTLHTTAAGTASNPIRP